jgi:hypothetical protein
LLLAKTPTDTTISWSDPPGLYNVYRGENGAAGPWQYNQTCLASHVAGSSAQDTEIPGEGQFFFYVLSRVDACGESSLGTDSSGLERPNLSPCTPP